jgi:CheY-like chemotaxis protein
VKGEPLQKEFIKATHKQYVVIKVADTGTGMDEETRKRIFEPFFTTKEKGKGTGLGLAVVFGIVENHEGFIDVNSEVGRGTTFSLYFPVTTQEEKRVEPQQQSTVTSLRGTETLLIIEDEVLLKELLTAMLSAKGYTVFSAADGEEGVSLYSQHGEDIDLVISDFGLPKFDGFEVLKRLKRINPEVKFVLATGFIEPEQRSQMFGNGAKDIIQKPYTPESVMKAIRGVLDTK